VFAVGDFMDYCGSFVGIKGFPVVVGEGSSMEKIKKCIVDLGRAGREGEESVPIEKGDWEDCWLLSNHIHLG